MSTIEFAAVATDKVGEVRVLGERPVAVNPKAYPLEIENVGGDTYILMSRGHHDVHEFMKKVRAEGYAWPLGMPEHRWCKAVPSRDPSLKCLYALVEPGVKGAFPATYALEAYNEDSYESLAAGSATAA